MSHTVHPLWPFSLLRSSRVTAPWCQTMFVAFCSAIGRRALARSVPGWQALANFVLALACAHGVSPKTTGWSPPPGGDRLSTEAFRRMARVALIKALHRAQPGRVAALRVSCSGPATTRASSTSRTSWSFRSRRPPLRGQRLSLALRCRRARQGVGLELLHAVLRRASTSCCIEVLREFDPDLIGFSLTSLPMKPAAEITARLKQHYPRACRSSGAAPGPTLEPEWCIEHADMVCTGEGEELIVELANRIDAGPTTSTCTICGCRRDGESSATRPGRCSISTRSPSRTSIRRARSTSATTAPPRRLSAHSSGPAVPDHDPARLPVLVLLLHRERVPGHVRQEELAAPPLGRRRHRGAGAGEAEARHPPGDVLRRRLHREPALAARVRAALQARGRPAVLVLHVSDDHPKEDLLLLKDAGLRSITMGIQSGSEEILQEFQSPGGPAEGHRGRAADRRVRHRRLTSI